LAAEAMELFAGQVCVMIHTGSRGIGHQTCTDEVAALDRAGRRLGLVLPDRQLACAPVRSPEAERYLGAMAAAANYARANRQVLADGVREAFASVLGRGPGSAGPAPAPSEGAGLGLELVYDVSHIIAKLETFPIG